MQNQEISRLKIEMEKKNLEIEQRSRQCKENNARLSEKFEEQAKRLSVNMIV